MTFITFQIVECLLEFYSRAAGELKQMDKPLFGWGVQMSAILAECVPLHRALLVHIWKMVTEKVLYT